MYVPVYHFQNFLSTINDEEFTDFPFYGVLLYTHSNGLQQAIHEYVFNHEGRLGVMTGPNFLVYAVENSQDLPAIEKFAPDDVYEIGRYLGAQPRQLPCLVLFTDPKNRNDSIILELKDFLPPSSELEDEDFTDLFATLSSLVDSSVSAPNTRRLRRLQQAINQEWPPTSRLSGIISQGSTLATSAVATTATIANASNQILTILSRASGG